STRTVTVAGVNPWLGVTLTPGSEELIVNGTFAPPGSEITNVFVAVLRSQKLPWNTRLSTEVTKRGVEFNVPIGRMSTPESEAAYIVEPLAERIALPAKCSGSWSESRSVRLSASRIVSTGGSLSADGTSE